MRPPGLKGSDQPIQSRIHPSSLKNESIERPEGFPAPVEGVEFLG